MILSSRTKISELTKEYPFIIDFMPTLSPEYKKLQNPIIRKTMGAVVSMEKVAGIGELELDYLLNAVADEIERQTGERPEVDLGGTTGTASAPAPSPIPTSEPMSQEQRKEALKAILMDLHAGGDMAELKTRFAETIADISPSELAEVEQSLIADGLPEEEVKNFCSLHVDVFKESLDKGDVPSMPGGHPVHTYMMENRAAENIVAELDTAICDLGVPPAPEMFAARRDSLLANLENLGQLDIHYTRKENQLFPTLEQHGITGPTQVMWAVHDDIRAAMKDAVSKTGSGSAQEAVSAIDKMSVAVKDMIYKEEYILYPMSLENLSESDWLWVRKGEEDIGYAWVMPSTGWEPKESVRSYDSGDVTTTSFVNLDTGALSLEQINLMLKHLPMDITYVDDNDQVAYFSATDDRIFPRSPGIIGREVSKCHPPKSVHIVERIVSGFKSGERDVAEFWIQRGGVFVHIRYFAVRDDEGTYKGTIEVSQDLTELRKLEGEQRLLDWE